MSQTKQVGVFEQSVYRPLGLPGRALSGAEPKDTKSMPMQSRRGSTEKKRFARAVRALLGAFSVLLLVACLGRGQVIGESAPNAQTLLESGDHCRKSLLASSRDKRYRENWLNCIGTYSQIYTRFPDSDEAAWALYHAARLYRDMYRVSHLSSDLDEALDLFERLVREHPEHRLADDAQFGMGDIQENYRNNPTQAYLEYLKVNIRYPDGDMHPFAAKRLDVLTHTLSAGNGNSGKRAAASKTSTSVVGTSEVSGSAAPAKAEKARVTDIRHWSTPSYTRVVVDLTGPVQYQEHLLKADPDIQKPRRFYIDLKNAVVPSQIDTVIPIKDDLLQRARAGQYDKETVRVVLDMEKVGRYKVFHLYDPFRIVVDVQRPEDSGKSKQQAAKKRSVQKGIRKAEEPEDGVSLARQLGLGVKRIVIDPGHGGKDPGCVGKGGLKEKDITLALARTLADQIKKELGCEVILTRSKDTYLPLERRTAIANIEKADLFISLHVNAHRDSRIHGLETYFLNMALDEGAMMVAARENATSEKNISDLQRILNDLMLNTKINESSRLAHEVQQGMVERLAPAYRGVKSLGVKQAPFYVLIGAQMPAVLVEVGFITNGSERKRLPSRAYQKRVAQGISDGIRIYVHQISMVYKGG